MDLEGRREAADENLIGAFGVLQERLAHPNGGRARFGAVDVRACGVSTAFFNPVFAMDPASEPTDVAAAIAWVERRGLPATVIVREDSRPEVAEAAEALGLVADRWHTPALVLDPIPDEPSTRELDERITVRTGEGELRDDWWAAFEADMGFRELFADRFLTDPAVRLAVGYHDGVPVGGALAITCGQTLGVYVVGTLERARRRGIGRAATWAAIQAGRAAWGSSIAILQSSEMGLPLYRSMGFVEVSRYVELARPSG